MATQSGKDLKIYKGSKNVKFTWKCVLKLLNIISKLVKL